MICVVVDTNILVSPFISKNPTSAPHLIYKAIQDQKIKLILTLPILDEIEDVLKRPEIAKYHRLSAEEIDKRIDELAAFSEIVTETITIHAIVDDPKDDKFIEAAIAGKAEYLVTGDKKHVLKLGEYQGVKIITARQFVTDVLQI